MGYRIPTTLRPMPATINAHTVVPWTLRLAARSLAAGLDLYDGCGRVRHVTTRDVARELARDARRWWHWTTALPGDLFEDFVRDQLVQVRGGIGPGRTVAAIERRAVRSPAVQRLGLDQVLALAPATRTTRTWRDLDRISRRHLDPQQRRTLTTA